MYFIIVKDVISHSLRVMNYTRKLCKEFNISKKEKTNLIIAALLHDIGKFMIPKKTLFKKSQLSIDEKEIINKHSEYSYEILKWALSKEILYLIKNHHNLCLLQNRNTQYCKVIYTVLQRKYNQYITLFFFIKPYISMLL